MKNQIILHQIKRSAYSEKIRLMLDMSGLDWLRVDAPAHTNKREVQRILVDGYSRRLPLLQVGADLYCDTDVITHQLSLMSDIQSFSKENLGNNQSLAIELEKDVFRVFLGSIPPAQLLKAYFKDYTFKDFSGFLIGRVQSFKGVDLPTMPYKVALEKKEVYLKKFDEMLKNQMFLLDDNQPCIVDYSLYHHVWYQEINNNIHTIEPYKNIMRWFALMKSKRRALAKEVSGQEALLIAKESQPQAIPHRMLESKRLGQVVTLRPNDYAGQATLPVTGIVVGEDDHKIILKRESKETGIIHVHFPKNALGACM